MFAIRRVVPKIRYPQFSKVSESAPKLDPKALFQNNKSDPLPYKEFARQMAYLNKLVSVKSEGKDDKEAQKSDLSGSDEVKAGDDDLVSFLKTSYNNYKLEALESKISNLNKEEASVSANQAKNEAEAFSNELKGTLSSTKAIGTIKNQLENQYFSFLKEGDPYVDQAVLNTTFHFGHAVGIPFFYDLGLEYFNRYSKDHIPSVSKYNHLIFLLGAVNLKDHAFNTLVEMERDADRNPQSYINFLMWFAPSKLSSQQSDKLKKMYEQDEASWNKGFQNVESNPYAPSEKLIRKSLLTGEYQKSAEENKRAQLGKIEDEVKKAGGSIQQYKQQLSSLGKFDFNKDFISEFKNKHSEWFNQMEKTANVSDLIKKFYSDSAARDEAVQKVNQLSQEARKSVENKKRSLAAKVDKQIVDSF